MPLIAVHLGVTDFLILRAANSDRRIGGNGHDADLVRRPLPCDAAWSCKSSICRLLSWHYFLPGIYHVADADSFKGSAFDFLIDNFRGFISIELDFCLASTILDPRPLDFSDDVIAFMVK